MATKKTTKQTAANKIDTQLARYRSMRDFHVTAEPSGAKSVKAKKSELPFVIQKHAASHLHYDFRLGWNGVLKSWAVAKGPSYYTKDKRLAVQVEDHPMEYGGFEGIIPKGQYGGGTVMVWDQGTWEPHGDVDEGLSKGSLKFALHGTKMRGNWTLIRMGGKAANERKPNWLLIKEHDAFEHGEKAPCITEEKPNSAVTGRTLDQIGAQEDHVWNSKDTAKGKAWYRQEKKAESVKPQKKAASKKASSSPPAKMSKKKAQNLPRELTAAIDDAPAERFLAFIAPQLALQSRTPSDAEGWLHELKLDGYRMQAHLRDGKCVLLTRTGLDWTHRMREVARAVEDLPVENAVFDGEVVALAANGTTSFANLQAAFQNGDKNPLADTSRYPLTYFAFDLLHLNGRNLRGLPLLQRKEILAQVLGGGNDESPVRFSDHILNAGPALFDKACAMHAEGIISKRAGAPYRSGRSADWLKLKCIREQELVIGGFTLPSNGIHGVGALLLGYYRDGKLIYAGRTGTGFAQKMHKMMRDKLNALQISTMPFEKPPAEARRGAHWVKPQLVAQIRFATWTADDLVRQASFKGLREDKPAKEVRREEVAVESATETKSKSAKKSVAKSEAEHAPVRLTHPEKILDAESQVTKQMLADYYWAIAPRILPQIAHRPLSLVRCPEGSTQPCFFQKHKNHLLPPEIESVRVPDIKHNGKSEEYITLSTAKALAGLAQMGVLEIHPWGSTNDNLEHPDYIIFDLDPDTAVPWKTLTASAQEMRKRLKALGLESFLKTTGGKGLHVVAPIKPEHDWATVKKFAHSIVLQMEKENPELYLTKMTKAARKNKIYLDYLRNERGATAVAAFSPRARAGMHVAMPLAWEELKAKQPLAFPVAEFASWKKRLAKDPWAAMPKTKQRITATALKKLGAEVAKAA